MQTTELTNDSKAILLLCGVFGGKANSNQINPLSITEYNKFASVLIEKELRPGDILNPRLLEDLNSEFMGRFEFERIKGLLNRGASLAFSVEKWINKGIWITTRSDKHYPQKLWKRFSKYCPPVIFGAGDADLLNCDGLAVVGSRNVDSEGEAYTKEVGKKCAELSLLVVSGGARGVDQIAMTSCLESYGSAIGILADGLLQASVSGKYRSAIMDRRLVLLSPYNPEARFSVGNAMSRNKYIYSFSKYALIISSEKDKGGTWAGATEELKRQNGIRVFVRAEGSAPKGNFELLKLGARAFPIRPWNDSLIKNLEDLDTNTASSPKQTSMFETEESRKKNQKEESVYEGNNVEIETKNELQNRQTIYDAVMPMLIEQLDEWITLDLLTERLGVRKIQLQDWINQGIEEGLIQRKNRPVMYKSRVNK